MGAMFVTSQPSLLSTPPASRRRQANRRKTMAGVDIEKSAAGFSIRRTSARIKNRRKVVPVMKEAETMLCQNLGIVKDGEVVTEAAMAEFARLFKNQIPPQVMRALAAFFKINSAEDEEVVAALIDHGGAAALEVEADAAENIMVANV